MSSSTDQPAIETTTPGPSSTCTGTKEIKPAERSKEAQKLQAIKYFKMKSGIQVLSFQFQTHTSMLFILKKMILKHD